MAVGKTKLSNVSALIEYLDSASNATSEDNVTAAAPTIYQLKTNNSGNAAAVYTKIWDNAAPTVGTTAPNWILKVKASGTLKMTVARSDAAGGATMQTALSFATVTTAGTAGTTNPTTAPSVAIIAV